MVSTDTKISVEEIIDALKNTKFLAAEKRDELIARIEKEGMNDVLAVEVTKILQNELEKTDEFISKRKIDYAEQEKDKQKELAEIQPALQQLWDDTSKEMDQVLQEYLAYLATLDKEVEGEAKVVAEDKDKQEIDDIRKNLGLG